MQERAEDFAFGRKERDGRKIRFEFLCSRHGTFTEEVEFGSADAVPEGLLTLLHVALGVSTYKAAAARRITFPPLGPKGRAMAEALYSHGLAEFFVRSGLPYPSETIFAGDIEPSRPPASRLSGGEPLVAFGGGKDSYVAGRIVERAYGSAPRFASVVLSEAVADTIERTAGHPLLFIRRSLDPKLLALSGAFTGHVPITAINILVLTVEGLLRNSGPILFANERSADEPTMTAGGVEANHQYSKSSAFEALVREAVAEAAPEAPPSFSVLRPFSELWIGERFADIKHAFGRFTSCNRNFRLAGDAGRRWCGACAKCAFTSLILTPFLTRGETETIFGQVMLDQPSLQGYFRELCGLSDQKPWDCVGTISECQAALYLASEQPAWRDTLAVRSLMPELVEAVPEKKLAQQVREARTPAGPGALPGALYQAALSL